MTLNKTWSNHECVLQYKTDPDQYNEFWYSDTKNILKNYDIIIIDSLIVPMEIGNNRVIQFLMEFCRLMTVGNRVIIYDNEEFIKFLETIGSHMYYDACSYILDEILTIVGFDKINVYEHSCIYKDVYIYTKSKIGMEVYNIIQRYYEYNEED